MIRRNANHPPFPGLFQAVAIKEDAEEKCVLCINSNFSLAFGSDFFDRQSQWLGLRMVLSVWFDQTWS
jgi:hypothetical protein